MLFVIMNLIFKYFINTTYNELFALSKQLSFRKIKGKKSICMVNWFSINVPGEQNWKRIVFSTNGAKTIR